eukprot:scaffold205367_cov38-Prasinocladus_malaysianus.AAC.1
METLLRWRPESSAGTCTLCASTLNLDDGELVYQIEEACSLALGVIGRGDELADAESVMLTSETSEVYSISGSSDNGRTSGSGPFSYNVFSPASGSGVLPSTSEMNFFIGSDSSSMSGSSQDLSSVFDERTSSTDSYKISLDDMSGCTVAALTKAGSQDILVESVGVVRTSAGTTSGSDDSSSADRLSRKRSSVDSPGWFFKRPLQRHASEDDLTHGTKPLVPSAYHASMDFGTLAPLTEEGEGSLDAYLATVAEQSDIPSPFGES